MYQKNLFARLTIVNSSEIKHNYNISSLHADYVFFCHLSFLICKNRASSLKLSHHIDQCNDIQLKINTASQSLALVEQHAEDVASESSAAFVEIKKLLQQKVYRFLVLFYSTLSLQKQLSSLARSIERKLQYYEEYDALRTIVGNPGFSATHPSFFEVLNRIDAAITFMRSHVCVVFSLTVTVYSLPTQIRQII